MKVGDIVRCVAAADDYKHIIGWEGKVKYLFGDHACMVMNNGSAGPYTGWQFCSAIKDLEVINPTFQLQATPNDVLLIENQTEIHYRGKEKK